MDIVTELSVYTFIADILADGCTLHSDKRSDNVTVAMNYRTGSGIRTWCIINIFLFMTSIKYAIYTSNVELTA